MQVSYGEGVANHTAPESCLGRCKAVWEALTGECAGWVMSRERFQSGAPTAFPRKHRKHRDRLRGNTGTDYGFICFSVCLLVGCWA